MELILNPTPIKALSCSTSTWTKKTWQILLSIQFLQRSPGRGWGHGYPGCNWVTRQGRWSTTQEVPSSKVVSTNYPPTSSCPWAQPARCSIRIQLGACAGSRESFCIAVRRSKAFTWGSNCSFVAWPTDYPISKSFWRWTKRTTNIAYRRPASQASHLAHGAAKPPGFRSAIIIQGGPPWGLAGVSAKAFRLVHSP